MSALVLAGALALTACGGGDDASSEDGGAADDGTASADSEDAEADDPSSADTDESDDQAEEADGEDDGADGGDESEDSDGDVDLAAVEFAGEPQRIEYSIQGEQQGMPASMTIAHDGARVATYMTVEESGRSLETAAFIDGGESVAFCIKESGTWSCFAEGSPEDDMIEETSVDEGELSDYLADPYRDEIAGREAICGTNQGFSQAEGGDVCVDARTGVLLRLDLGAGTGESLIMEAVSVTAASEEDFTPPAEPGSFGG
ncbi:MAG: hypothetical protein WD638_11145 [Nitriliruptoraceae bacterium]